MGTSWEGGAPLSRKWVGGSWGKDEQESLGEAMQGKREAQEAPGAPGAIGTLWKTDRSLCRV